MSFTTKENLLDQYFTTNDTILICLELLKKNQIDLEKFDEIIEPSAGSGNWLKYLPKYLAYDISPLNDVILQQDFLKLDFNDFLEKNILTIGNPPFGKNCNLATNFFNYAANFSNYICFIVPRTFRKKSIQNRLNLNFHLIDEIILPENSFYEPFTEEFILNIPTTFQIWQRKPIKRKLETKKTFIKNFNWCQYKDNPDFAIRRVGVNAGKVYIFNNQNPASHLFIHEKEITLQTFHDFYKIIDNKNSCKYDTAGNPSLTKEEFENHFNIFILNSEKKDI